MKWLNITGRRLKLGTTNSSLQNNNVTKQTERIHRRLYRSSIFTRAPPQDDAEQSSGSLSDHFVRFVLGKELGLWKLDNSAGESSKPCSQGNCTGVTLGTAYFSSSEQKAPMNLVSVWMWTANSLLPRQDPNNLHQPRGALPDEGKQSRRAKHWLEQQPLHWMWLEAVVLDMTQTQY